MPLTAANRPNDYAEQCWLYISGDFGDLPTQCPLSIVPFERWPADLSPPADFRFDGICMFAGNQVQAPAMVAIFVYLRSTI